MDHDYNHRELERLKTLALSRSTLLLEVCVVLGKALVGGSISIEGRWRVMELVRFLRARRRPDVHPLIVFSGYSPNPSSCLTEAESMKELFTWTLHQHGFQWRGSILLEEEARFSVENIRNTVDKLNLIAKQCQDMVGEDDDIPISRFHLVSTDYHLDRLWDVDEYLQEISEIGPLRKMGREVCPIRAPYVFVNCGDPEREWLARGYVQMQKLSLLEMNILGVAGDTNGQILRGRVRELRAAPFATLHDAQVVLETMIETVPENEGPFADKVNAAKTCIPETLEQMRRLQAMLPSAVGERADSEDPRWERCRGLMRQIMKLRTHYLDPDGT